MKMKHLLAVCGMAVALICGAGTVNAQQDNSGGPGGGRSFRGRGNFNPEQMQQDYMQFIRNYLGFTNDTDWNAVQPLVQKVIEGQRAVGSSMGNGFRLFIEQRMADRNGGQSNSGRTRRFRGGMFGGEPSPEYTALQDAINNNAPDSQIKGLLDRYNAAQRAKQDKLKAAQDNLRAVLAPGKQEAQATVLGLLN